MLAIGSIVDGKYKILSEIGHGGMSVVYMAINETANKTWAIKEVRKDPSVDMDFVTTGLMNEINTLKKLKHPYLPSIVDVIDDEDSYLIVMDYIEGRSLDKIIEETGVKIDISDDNVVFIASPDSASADKAKKIIDAICKDPEKGDVYEGRIARIIPIGAFVEIAPGKDGMIHISKLSNERVEKVEDVVNIGDLVRVKVIKIDEKKRIDLRLMEILEKAE